MLKSLDDRVFRTFFDNDSRLVKEHEFRKSVFRGIDSIITSGLVLKNSILLELKTQLNECILCA